MKVFILILFVNICFSQDIEKLKKIDTVYIFFNYGNYEKITEFKAQNKNKTTYLYQFFSSNGDYINFSYSSFKDFEHLTKGIKTDIKTVSKKFLRKNKDKILDINSIINIISNSKNEKLVFTFSNSEEKIIEIPNE